MTLNNKSKITLNWSGFFLRLIILLLLLLTGYVGLLFLNINKNITKVIPPKDITAANTNNNLVALTKATLNKNKIKLKGVDSNRINVLLLGIGGVEHSGKYLTDTIALVSIDPQTYQAAILSIPRDLYVKIPNSNYHTKINALYTYGIKNKKMSKEDSVDLITKAVEKITAQEIHYHAILDFAGFTEIIKTIDGVNIQVENDIYDSRYPGPNYSYQIFQIKKGFHHLDAETALKYARVRHTKGGDFGRAHRQQQIIASAREKALSLKVLANPGKIINLINTLGDHLKTNISIKELPAILSLIKNINIQQATTKVLDAWNTDSLLRSTHVPLGGVSAYVLLPRAKNYSQIHSLSKNIFNLYNLKKNQEKIITENANISFLSPDYKTFALFKKTLLEWGYKTTASYNKTAYKKYCTNIEDSILSYTAKEKIFTLNDLTERLDTEITYIPQPTTTSENKKNSQKNTYDILLCISSDTAKYFNTQEKEITKKDFEYLQNILTEDGKVFISN
jgi:LCP family protein required for cell wall assembly